jgi:hypothetical protein
MTAAAETAVVYSALRAAVGLRPVAASEVPPAPARVTDAQLVAALAESPWESMQRAAAPRGAR